MPRPDRHNEIEINLLFSGSITYLLGGRRMTLNARTLGVFWAATPHQIVDFEGDATYFVATLPLSEFLRAGIERTVANRILQGELLTDSEFDDADELSFGRWERELKTKDYILERAAELEVRARLLRFARRISEGSPSSSNPMLSRADQLACYIARNYQKQLSSQSIADAVGVNPNYAMNLFRETFGTTITTFVTQHRISHAQRLLVTTDNSIVNISLESGFQSLSRFNEAFKTACGCSPREYRKSHRTMPHE